MDINIKMGWPKLNPSARLLPGTATVLAVISVLFYHQHSTGWEQIKYPPRLHQRFPFLPSPQILAQCYGVFSNLRKALLWTWRRRSRHTRSTPRTRDRNRTGDTRTVRRNTRPGRCTSPHLHVSCQTHKLTLNCVCVPRRKHSMTLVLTCSRWLGLGPLCTHSSAPQSPDHTHRLRTPAPRALGCSGCCSPRGFDGSHTRTGTPVRSPGYLGNPPAASKTAVGQQDSLLTRP